MGSRSTVSFSKMARNIPKIVAVTINDTAALFALDMTKGAKRGVDVTNRPFTPLDPSTIAAKKRRRKRKGGKDIPPSKTPSKPLFDTSRMSGAKGGYFVQTKATPTKLKATVTTAGDRRGVIGVTHNDGDGVPQRKHFIVPGRSGDLKRTSSRRNLILRRGMVKIARSGHK